MGQKLQWSRFWLFCSCPYIYIYVYIFVYLYICVMLCGHFLPMYSYDKNGRKASKISMLVLLLKSMCIYICIYLLIYKYELHHLKTRLSVTVLRNGNLKFECTISWLSAPYEARDWGYWSVTSKKLNLWSWQRSKMLH